MKKAKYYNSKLEEVKELNLNKDIFEITPNNYVVKDAITLSLASVRQGTHSTKTRSEVNGGGRKPYRQKGTGHARQGSIRAVQFVGGGRYGTPVPRDYSKKQNRKERLLALKSALSQKAIDNEIVVIEKLELKDNKTSTMSATLKKLEVANKKVLLVLANDNREDAILSSRNLQNVILIFADEINVLDIISSDIMVIEEEALKYIEEVLK